jgi:hypothetical protein
MSSTTARDGRPVGARIALAACAAAIFLAVASASPAGAAGHCTRLKGTTGSDDLVGRAGADCVSGGPGADFLDGGHGADRLRGGPGNDQVRAGVGRDRVWAGSGDDLISAQDGVAETIDCGPGDDLVSADVSDVTAGCEKVNLGAPQVEWRPFWTHINAYGYELVTRRGWGSCNGETSHDASCKGGAEDGTSPFNTGPMTMDWEKAIDGFGQSVTVKATAVDAQLEGKSDPGWVWARIDAARIRQWVDPRAGFIRSGQDGLKRGNQGGPLTANLSHHSYPNPFDTHKSGYSLDLKGYLEIIRF